MTSYSENEFTINWTDPADEDTDETIDSATSDDEDSYDSSSADSYLSVDLSETHNNEKTVFCPGDDAYLIVLASGEYTLEVTHGNVRKEMEAVPIRQVEIVNADQVTEIELSYTPDATPDIVWNPPVDAAITIDGRKITLSEAIFSIATITYDTLSDIWVLADVTETTDVRVLASADDDTSALTVSFQCDTEETEEGEQEEIGLAARYCDTGETVSGVKVWADGDFQGATNSEGIISIGVRTVGSVVAIRWVYGEHSGETELTI